MSIYATLAEIAIRRFGDENFVEIRIQGVPPHIDDTGPNWAFLPPPVDPDGTTMRAVVFVEKGDQKGTQRNGQEYERPLLLITGQEYQATSFPTLLDRLQRELDRRYGPRPWGLVYNSHGTKKNIYGPGDSPSDKDAQ